MAKLGKMGNEMLEKGWDQTKPCLFFQDCIRLKKSVSQILVVTEVHHQN